MAWNEPGGDKKDPWNNGSRQGPPDLDEALKKLQRQLNKFLGGKGNNNNNDPNTEPAGDVRTFGFGLIAALFLVLWILSGIYIVAPAEKAAVLRFGRYVETVGPGPHWFPRFIESVYKLNVEQLFTYEQEALMLNKDENIVSAKVSVMYRKADPKQYFFNVVNPEVSLQQATASALRQVVGHTTLDDVLTVGREKLRDEVFAQLITILQRYRTGIDITDVRIQSTKAPDEVKDAFDDAIKAREDLERYRNQAQAYSSKVVPIAEGDAKRIIQEAEAYKAQEILKAQGEVSRFLALLPEYHKAPKVTRERLYLAALQDVFSHTSKVLIDGKAGQNLMYLPLDRLMKNGVAEPQEEVQTESKVDVIQQDAPPSPISTFRPLRPGYVERQTRNDHLQGRG